eukprot:TRINITY_DN617_c0_g1_i2.p1 TRINITY_DN617_c0_g1~~TRINITY_DN617_c0_g1_i2.p1  ORF type:complete len:127 (-),score=21.34 TRINITY_DN617_c0_g1_i2:2164-2544(-)
MGLLDALKVWGPDKSRISPASLKVDEGFKPADFSKWGVKNFNELKMKDLPEYLGDRARWSNSRTLLPRFGRWYGFHFNGGNEGHYRTDIYKTTGRKIAGSRWVHAFLLCTAVHITMKNMFRRKYTS